ncbi:Sec-independent protein translocase protein TatB [Nitrosomonas sp. Nm132]|uniref:Sec-independent protein translocase protein TatB n=1 Tax=Nitrosomonas sp. Nm132 TaxID=1881053 RepID=UPI000882FC86|nr:Sec-independent protein translocase protein TatB [Nitrosomonas sp. Nm132]SDH39686.1 sec-independent protein translocase protein TatB [Nitrosomonas sp. Nm132]
MFDVSFAEMLVILIVALIVIGPERLPQVARTIGHLLGRVRRYVDNVKNDIRHEIELDELRRLKNSVQETTDSIEQSVRKEFDQIQAATDLSAAEKTTKTVLPGFEQISAPIDNTLAAQSQSSLPQQTSESNKNSIVP